MPDNIPFMRLDRQVADHREAFLAAAAEVLESGQVLQGPAVKTLEARLCEIAGLKHCVTLGSGTDAVSFAIAALGLEPGSRIAVTSMTFIASASPILHNHCVPVFVDVDPETMLMDLDATGQLIEAGRVDAVIAVHLYGQMLALEDLAPIAERHGVAIIEDAAQVLGATRHGNPAGRVGRIMCLSFDPTKVVGAFGSGGALLTDDDAVAEFVRGIRYHGQGAAGRFEMPGYNSQLHSLQAAFLDVKLDRLAEWQERRAKIARRYGRGLANLPDIGALTVLEGNEHNYHKYVIAAQDRDGLAEHLSRLGIQTKIHYPTPLHQQPIFNSDEAQPALPRVEAAVGRILSLPIYPEMTDAEADRVIEGIRLFCAAGDEDRG
jgi:dTDP-4-amino-4,6-dideoxygalactose transaminase